MDLTLKAVGILVFAGLGGCAQMAIPAPTDAERSAILKPIQSIFDASNEIDANTILAATLAEGVATRADTGADGVPRVRHLKWSELAQRPKAFDAKFHAKLEQRLIDPEIRVRDNIAMVWGRYELRIGGKLDRCGVDHFDLIRINGQWRVLNLTWTEQKIDCAVEK
jgi:hypothetical protein